MFWNQIHFPKRCVSIIIPNNEGPQSKWHWVISIKLNIFLLCFTNILIQDMLKSIRNINCYTAFEDLLSSVAIVIYTSKVLSLSDIVSAQEGVECKVRMTFDGPKVMKVE
jgi:hypothetical protein